MRVAFAGTPEFAARALESLIAAGHSLPLVLTQPDRPSGRGLRPTPSAVAAAARRHGLEVAQPATLRNEDGQVRLRELQPDVLVVAAYGLILPPAVLSLPRRGCLNIHASLLPRWRGAAPIHRAILAGDATTGISIMQMDAGLDTGPVLLEEAIPIFARDTSGSLHDRLAELGARLIVDALARIDSLVPQPQDGARATYAAKVSKAEARLDWRLPAPALDRQIRAFNPAPGAEARLGGEVVKVWQAEPVAASGGPGQVFRDRGEGLVVACGTGALRLDELQRAGGRRMRAADFIRGHSQALAGGFA